MVVTLIILHSKMQYYVCTYLKYIFQVVEMRAYNSNALFY